MTDGAKQTLLLAQTNLVTYTPFWTILTGAFKEGNQRFEQHSSKRILTALIGAGGGVEKRTDSATGWSEWRRLP